MKVLIKNSFVAIEGKDLVPYYMNKEYDLEDSIANNYIEKGYATSIETKKTKKEEVAETKPKTAKGRKKKTEEK